MAIAGSERDSQRAFLFDHKSMYLVLAAVGVALFTLSATYETPRTPIPMPNEPVIGLKVPFSSDLRMIADPRAERFVAPTTLPDAILPLSELDIISSQIVTEPTAQSTQPLLPVTPIIGQVIGNAAPPLQPIVDTITDPLDQLVDPVEDIVDEAGGLVEGVSDVVDDSVGELLPDGGVSIDLGL